MSRIFVITLSEVIGLIFFCLLVLYIVGGLIAARIKQRKYRE